LQLGFALAGKVDPTLLAACEAFGVPAGIAFQLHDDHLGIFGDIATGKSNHDDLREGKFTLMVAHASAQADGGQKKKLQALLGNAEATEDDLKAFRDILLATGADEYCQQQALVYADHARRQLADGAIGSPAMTEVLDGLLGYIVTRNK
jgi:geranylgeranyl diphosphate synthase type I